MKFGIELERISNLPHMPAPSTSNNWLSVAFLHWVGLWGDLKGEKYLVGLLLEHFLKVPFSYKNSRLHR